MLTETLYELVLGGDFGSGIGSWNVYVYTTWLHRSNVDRYKGVQCLHGISVSWIAWYISYLLSSLHQGMYIKVQRVL